MKPIEKIDQAFLQLTFAIKLWIFADLGRIDKAVFDHEVVIEGVKTFPANSFHTKEDVISGALNTYMISLAFTANALDAVLSEAGFASDLPADNPRRDLRALVYMVRCAFAHDTMHPRWKAVGPFKRKLAISLPSGSLIIDMAQLDGKQFSDKHIGGMRAYFEVKDEVKLFISDLVKT
jgi:hypothetical protein